MSIDSSTFYDEFAMIFVRLAVEELMAAAPSTSAGHESVAIEGRSDEHYHPGEAVD